MRVFLIMLSLVALSAAARAPSFEGEWIGTALRGGEARAVSLRIASRHGGYEGSYSVPTLGLEEIPLSRLSVDPDSGMLVAPHQIELRIENRRLTGILAPMLLHGAPAALTLEPGALEPPATRERPVEFVSGGFRLKGTLVSPLDRGRHPAMVSLHGSGPSTRWPALARARRFARAGYAMLIFDKRGSGESEGDWTRASLDDAARDALAAMAFLSAQPEVDSRRIGLWAHSQAGWVVGRAAGMSDKIAFAIVLAGGAARPLDVERFGYRNVLDHAGVVGADRDRAMALVERYFAYLRTGEGYEALMSSIREASAQPWGRALSLARVTPEPESRPKWQWVATYDPAEDIRHMGFPVLLLFAEADRNTPPGSLSLWEDYLRAAGNSQSRSRLFAGADHHFLVAGAGTDGWPRLADGYYETQIEWLDVITAPPSAAAGTGP